MQLNTVRTTVFVLTLLGLGGVHAWAQDEPSHRGQREIELTNADLFSRPDWSSSGVQICGLRLKMSRKEANLAARAAGLQLVQNGPHLEPLPCANAHDCHLAGSRPWDYEDVTVVFGTADEVTEIIVEVRPPELRGAVIRRFKGQTYEFFNGEYSNESRLRLFGPESSQRQVSGRFGDKLKDTQYLYPRRGFTITVSPEGIGHPKLELTEMTFYPPS